MDWGLSPCGLEAVGPGWVTHEARPASQKGTPTPCLDGAGHPRPPRTPSAPSDSPPPVAQRLPRGRPPAPRRPAPTGAPCPSAWPLLRLRPAGQPAGPEPSSWQGRRRSGRRPRVSFIHRWCPVAGLPPRISACEGPAPLRTTLQTPLSPPRPGPVRDQVLEQQVPPSLPTEPQFPHLG